MKNTNIKLYFNVTGTFRNINGEITHQFKKKNLVVDTGLASLAARIAGSQSPTTKGIITYCALGTVPDAVQASDTQLISEVYRKQISSRGSSDNVATFRTFFNTTEGNYLLREIGLFGDNATNTADSGTLFCRLIINRQKTSAETLTLDWEVTFAAS